MDSSQLYSCEQMDSYFARSQTEIQRHFFAEIEAIRTTLDEVFQQRHIVHAEAERVSQSIALCYRAGKFLYTALNLTEAGHTAESRVLFRNVVELILMAHFVRNSNKAFIRYMRFLASNVEPTLGFQELRKLAISDLPSDSTIGHFMKIWAVYSSLASHENAHNISQFLDAEPGKITLYVGHSIASPERLEYCFENIRTLVLDVNQMIGLALRP